MVMQDFGIDSWAIRRKCRKFQRFGLFSFFAFFFFFLFSARAFGIVFAPHFPRVFAIRHRDRRMIRWILRDATLRASIHGELTGEGRRSRSSQQLWANLARARTMSPRVSKTQIASRRVLRRSGRFNYSSAKLRTNFRIKVDLALGTGTRKRTLTNLPLRHRELSRFPFKSGNRVSGKFCLCISPLILTRGELHSNWCSKKLNSAFYASVI